MKNNHFKIIIPLYNVEKWIKICLRSIKAQTYKNFHCIIMDDLSTDNSVEIIKKEIEGDDKFLLNINKEKAFALKNIYDAINLSNPSDDDIIITVDGDDWLANKDVLSCLNEFYSKEDCWVTYGSYAEYPDSKRGKFAKQIPQYVIDSDSYRQHEWCSSHLRTFKYHLWGKIKKQDLLDSEGNFYCMAWDLAFMFPMLEMAGVKSHYIKDILYIYNMSNPLNDHKIDNAYQQQLEREIRSKKKYETLVQKKITINFIDNNISHAISYNDTLEPGRPSLFLEYVRGHSVWQGVSVFTDNRIKDVTFIKSDYKVAWLMEPRAFSPSCYSILESMIHEFNFVLTYDSKLLREHPRKCIFTPADGIFLDHKSVFAESVKKEKMISHIFSNKKQLKGHRLRHTVAEIIKENGFNVDLYGYGSGNSLSKKSDGLNPYFFSIIIENNRDKNYFTEKILDAFACRAIPIYWGAPNISDWFDMDSIICFENLIDLKEILMSLTEKDYYKRFKSLMRNYKKSLEFFDYDKIISKNIQEGLDGER